MTTSGYQHLIARRTPVIDRSRDACPLCHDTGFSLVTEHGMTYAQTCACRAEREAQRHMTMLERQSNIPPRYLSATFEAFHPQDRSQSHAKAALERLVKRFPTGGRGVLLMGTPGTGKTHLAVSAIRALMTKKRARCCFVDCVKYLADLQARIGAAPRSLSGVETRGVETRGTDTVIAADCIVLDDLGSYKLTAWAQDQIGLIIGERYNNNALTIITTNWLDRTDAPAGRLYNEETLEDRIGARLRSRLAEICEPFHVTGPDYRRK